MTVLVLLLSAVVLFTVHHRAVADTQIEEKIYSTATLEDEFADDKVVVVLNKEASMNFRTYTLEDFPSGFFRRVDDSTALTMELVRRQLKSEETGDWSELQLYVENSMLVDVENFRRILDLTLAERSKENVLQTIKILEKRDDVIYVGPDYFTQIAATPSPLPTYYNNQTAAFNSISLQNAWDISTGSSSIVVGVLDTGIESSNASLYNRIHTTSSRDFSTGTTHGLANNYGLNDPCLHGTQVAGIIGANGANIIGVNWNVTLVSLKVFRDSDCKGTGSYVRYAVDYATSQGIPILNYSGGGYSNDAAQQTAIGNYPGLFVAAAGNEGLNINSTPFYPASYNLPRLISVGAMNANHNAPANWSNYGNNRVHIFAPGTDIYVTYSSGYTTHYGYNYGTSFAAPFVTGIAALIKAHYGLNAAHIKGVIAKNGDKLPAFNGYTYGGRLNAQQTFAGIQTCVTQVNMCILTYDPTPYLAMCSPQCLGEAPSYCFDPPIDYIGCVNWMHDCMSNCEAQANNYCGNQYSSCMGI
jgi:subtilisin family serine protease